MMDIIKQQSTIFMVLAKYTEEVNLLFLKKDEPPVLLGEDDGANSVDYALAALNGCLTISLIYHHKLVTELLTSSSKQIQHYTKNKEHIRRCT